MTFEGRFQIGKNRVTEGVVHSINLALKTHGRIRISLLKSSGRNKDSIKKIADEITKRINCRCNYKIIGFTIILRKQSKKSKS